MSDDQENAVRLSGTAKMMVDFAPLALFMIAYYWGAGFAPVIGNMVGQNWSIGEGQKIYLAIGVFMPAFAVAFAYSVWKEKRAAPMLVVTGLIIFVMGSLTLLLKDKTFFFMKPTFVYLLFASLLGGGLWQGKVFLKTVFDGAFILPHQAWISLTIRFVFFFIVMAILNETAWRWLTRECDLLLADVKCAGEASWVNLKVFGFTILSVGYMALQIPFILKHGTDEEGIPLGESNNSDLKS